MSYCRWSDNNFKCDIYAYLSGNGYVIHIAKSRYEKESPPLPYAGESFVEDTLEGFETRLNELKDLGYIIPDRVFDRIEREKISKK